MNSFGEVEEQIISKVLMEEGLVVDDVEVVVDKLLLDSPVIAFNDAVDLGTSGIDEEMGDISFSQGSLKVPEVF